jgi:hypothetical protein
MSWSTPCADVQRSMQAIIKRHYLNAISFMIGRALSNTSIKSPGDCPLVL